MMDRSKMPLVSSVDTLDIPDPEQASLINGAPVYMFEAGSQEVSRIDWIFDAGSWHQPKKLIAHFTNRMLQEGSRKLSSSAIADRLDYFGSYFQLESNADYATLSLYSLNKHLPELLPLVTELLVSSVFPEKELGVLLNKEKQNLLLNLEKVSFQARRYFNEALFGQNHPYGQFASPEDFNPEILNRKALTEFFEDCYKRLPHAIIISGFNTYETLQLLDKTYGECFLEEGRTTQSHYSLHPAEEKMIHFEHKGAIQNAIRIGKRTIGKTHPDYMGLKIVNTVLGGYFGSRLMSNIREEKGYTYGIGSSITSYLQDAVFVIGTEVGSQYSEATIKEVLKETARLCREPIPDNELDIVRNYLSGVFLADFDGPFALADRFRDVLLFQMDFDYFRDYFQLIRKIEPRTMLQLAQKHLSPDTFTTVVVGS